MSGSTQLGFPWPSPSEPVAQGATNIRALAEAIDAFLRTGKLIGRQLAYAELTSNVTITSTNENAMTQVLACPFTSDGVTPVAVEVYCASFACPPNCGAFLGIQDEASAYWGRLANLQNPNAAGGYFSAPVAFRLPAKIWAAGARTARLVGWGSISGAIVQATYPMHPTYMRVVQA